VTCYKYATRSRLDSARARETERSNAYERVNEQANVRIRLATESGNAADKSVSDYALKIEIAWNLGSG